MTDLIIFVLLFAFELLYLRFARALNIVDNPNHRSSHTRKTILAGGIVFYIGFLLYFLFYGFEYPYFFTGLSLIALVSFADDIKPQSSTLRLLVHFIAVTLLLYQVGIFSAGFFIFFISLIVCTGIINAFNFMDGINGMTAGYSLVLNLALLYINNYRVEFVDNRLLLILLFAIVIFSFYNFRKRAVCFAGDVGAVTIAFIFVFLIGLLIKATDNYAYLVLLLLYGVDTILTLIHRILLRENIFEPHRKHLYQIMANELGLSHVAVSSIYLSLQAVISVGLLFFNLDYVYSSVVLIIIMVLYLIIKLKN